MHYSSLSRKKKIILNRTQQVAWLVLPLLNLVQGGQWNSSARCS